MPTLKNALMEWTSDKIKKYVILLGGTSTVTLKAKRAMFICEKLLNKPALRMIWKELDTVTQQAISNAYHNGGEFNQAAFVAQYGKLPPRPKKERRWSYYNREPILFDILVIDGQIADDLMPLLADLVLSLQRFQLEGVDDVPSTYDGGHREWDVMVVETELIGRADLLTYLRLVEQGKVRFGAKNKRLTAASLRKVLKNLMDSDFYEEQEKVTGRTTIRPFGLDVFSQESGLMTRTGKLKKAGREYLNSQDPELMLDAFETWSDSGKFDELTRLNKLRGLKTRGVHLTPAASRRRKVIEALSWCPVGRWINIKDFYRALVIWDFDFVVNEGYSSLYLGSRHYGELHGSNHWAVAHGLYINAIIWEYLGTMGAVDIAFVDEEYASFIDLEYYNDPPISLFDNLLYFRINPWGAFLLGQADEYMSTKPKQKSLFTIDADKKLHLFNDLLPNEQLQLEAMAEKIDEKMYQLSDERLLTAVESGQQFDQLSAFLQANHQGKMLASVSKWLIQLQKNMGVFKQGETAVIIQVAQPKLLKLTQQDKILAKLCQKVDAKTILVPSSKLSRFRKRLKALGYLLT